MKRYSLGLVVVLALALGGCSTRTIRNERMWYSISIPKRWKVTAENTYANNRGDTVRVMRVRDPASLRSLAATTRKSMQIEVPGYTMENEYWIKVRGRPSWMLVGTYKPRGGEEVTLVKVIINADKYKYLLDLTTPSEYYNERKLTLQQIINSFTVQFPSD